MTSSLKVVLLSSYEMGHQPLSLAWPGAALVHAGHTVKVVDLSVSNLPEEALAAADLIALAVPMHTAMRLGVEAAHRVRQINPNAHLTFYGLYAWLNAGYLLQTPLAGQPLADSVISGEYEAPLQQLARSLAENRPIHNIPGLSTAGQRNEPNLARPELPVPDRSQLPGLSNYAHLMMAGEARPAGYTETSRGCLHTCRHCPVVPVYNGRFFIVPLETVMADIRQQVRAGARHITFGDPDFLNGPGHALKVARALQREFPGLTFDFTTKVEHLLEKQALLPELRRLGAAFVISAFESVNDSVLERLHKGHTRADMEQAVSLLRDAELPVQPTWVAFTPWTTLEDYLAMLDWIRQQQLIPHVPAVQYAVRLLVPPGSAILDHPDTGQWLGAMQAADFGYSWQHPDPRMDELHQRVAAYAETVADCDINAYSAFEKIEGLAFAAAGQLTPRRETAPDLRLELAPPRLTEDWFC